MPYYAYENEKGELCQGYFTDTAHAITKIKERGGKPLEQFQHGGYRHRYHELVDDGNHKNRK